MVWDTASAGSDTMGRMKLRRTRVLVALAIATVALAMTMIPLVAWHHSRQEALRRDLDAELLDQMQAIQMQAIDGLPTVDFPAWVVDVDRQEITPLSNTDLEPPLYGWMRDTGEGPGFREYSLDGATTLRAYIPPIVKGRGFVTLNWTDYRDEQLAALDRRRWWMLALAVAGALGLGWLIAGAAVRPATRLLADRQGFLADAAHEMRTPLAVILASSSQTLSRPRQEEEYVRSLSEIRSAAERATTGVNELLDLVRLERGQVIPRLAPLRLDLLAEEIAASSREEAEVLAEPSQPVVVNADMALVRQAVDNLVRNAARRATRVELASHAEGRVGVIEVIDNGAGFDPALLEVASRRYHRGDRQGDVGIGLAIVEAIARAHGGEVVVANRTGDVTGAHVSLRLPLHSGA